MRSIVSAGIAALFMATTTAHAQVSKTDEVYCFFTRQIEITRRNQDRGGLVACTYDQESCQRIVNRPIRFHRKWIKPNPRIECAPGKLSYETPY
jgi:hypothetical protein